MVFLKKWEDMRVAARALQAVERKAAPLEALDRFVVDAARACSARFKGVRDKGSTPQVVDVMVFNEYLYFFLHMVVREAVVCQMTEAQISELQAWLGFVVSRVAVDSFFGHWPEE